MLVLGRRIGEKILIPQYNIEITLISTFGDKARIGIKAPDDVNIVRQEVFERNKENAGV